VLIELHALRRVYHMGESEVVALEELDLQIPPGEFVTIMGPSGSGKSTLMHLLGCLDRPTSGRYVLDGVEVHAMEDLELSRLRNQKVGFVFQSFNLIPQLSVSENVQLPLVYAGVRQPERRTRAHELLDAVGLRPRQAHRPNELSGGERQRVAIARALANRPKLLLADEPTGNLDSKTGLGIMRLFEKLHQNGTTLVLVTHDPGVAEWSDRVVRMLDGRIESDASTRLGDAGPSTDEWREVG
jgi:putative ABC transport system ATP-binding protein